MHRHEVEIEGILLGRNCLLHHGFIIENIPNLLPSDPRYLPRVRLPGVESPIQFLEEGDADCLCLDHIDDMFVEITRTDAIIPRVMEPVVTA